MDNKFGIAVATFGSPAYIHLQLESHRRYYNNVPLIVIDDSSYFCDALDLLCSHYKVDFSHRPVRLGHIEGDIKSYVDGIEWANHNKIDYLIKFSRRFIPIYDFREDFRNHIKNTNYLDTYADKCNYFKYPLRTECIALKTAPWLANINIIKPVHKRNAEYTMNDIALSIGSIGTGWGLTTESRMELVENTLWHDVSVIEDYHNLSLRYGLSYSIEDFEDVNNGQARGLENWWFGGGEEKSPKFKF